MAKYGKGLNREIYEAVISGTIPRKFKVEHIKLFAQSKNWNIPDNYLSVCLSNGASNSHSPNFKKYFEAIGNGYYTLKESNSKKVDRLAISPTDEDWFNLLKSNNHLNRINYWTPTPWNLKKLMPGDRLYFMLKAPIRKIGGYAEVVKYENMSINQAWNTYGLGNGVVGLEELIFRTSKYKGKRTNQKNDDQNPVIGCIELKEAVFFNPKEYLTPKDLGVSFPNQVVKISYFHGDFPNLGEEIPDLPTSSFSLVESANKKQKLREVNQRVGQEGFRKAIYKAYDDRCAITGESCKDLLQAAHIQPYKDENSNHVQNGILLRIDLHRLFDTGLITIDTNYRIRFSSIFQSKEYLKYDGKKIRLPLHKQQCPSIQALEYNNKYKFRE